MVKIVAKKTGNCGCKNCGKLQDGGNKMQPYSVYYKKEGEKRGCYNPVCSMKCATEYAMKFIEVKGE